MEKKVNPESQLRSTYLEQKCYSPKLVGSLPVGPQPQQKPLLCGVLSPELPPTSHGEDQGKMPSWLCQVEKKDNVCEICLVFSIAAGCLIPREKPLPEPGPNAVEVIPLMQPLLAFLSHLSMMGKLSKKQV